MAATGLNHGIGESLVTEAQAQDAVKLLLDLGLDPKGETTFGENALVRPGLSRLEHAAGAIDRSGRERECGQQGRRDAVTARRTAKATGSAAFYLTRKARICC